MNRAAHIRSLGISLLLVGLVDTAPAQSRDPQAASLTYRREERAFPTGDRATSVLLLERTYPAEVRRGSEFLYQLTLTNISRVTVEEVVLTEQFPATFRVSRVTPEVGRTDAGQASWGYRSMGPGATVTIQVVGSSDRPEDLTWCAAVAFKQTACVTAKVVEPRLALQKSMPANVVLCDDIPIRIVVTNTGTGVAENVRITDQLPAGLTTRDGLSAVAFDAGTLAGGQSREFTLVARAVRPGSYTNLARAVDASGLTADASASVVVTQPVLRLTKTGPSLRYLGRTAQFDLTVQNTGDAVARGATLVDNVPAGLEVVAADGDARLVDGQITWQLGDLAPNAARTVRLQLRPQQVGRMTNTATARAVCAEANAAATIDIQGIPAILLECIDDPDPVEVGGTTNYDIIVTNQGSANGTNIAIECTLPAEMEFVNSAGPTAGTAAGATLRFAPLPSLAPKAKATWRVTVKGVREGDLRFRVTLKSDQIDTVVEETESTRVY